MDKKGNELSLLYHFFYNNDSILIETIATENTTLTDGIWFDIKSDTVIGYVKGEGVFNEVAPNSRYQQPLKNDVKIFLKQHQYKLDPWLKSEAIRRKVIP